MREPHKMKPEKIKALEKKHVMQTYARFDVVIDSGKGCYVFDKKGKKYLDFLGGLATCSVGHGNKMVADAVARQAKKLIGITNLYYTEPQVVLAEKLSKLSGLKKCFFCNSGAESNEAAIKLAKKVTGKKEFIAFKDSFHGRTTASLAATWKVKFKEAFTPLAPFVKFVDFNNIDALKKAITKKIAGIIIEPIQGEAGVIVPEYGYLKKVKEICKKNKIMMIVDEVQTGMGRTGKFFAYQHDKITPDIVTTAKGLANGVPIGVCLSNLDFDKGDHASTFGGNNLSCAAAIAAIDFIEKNNLMKNASNIGKYFMEKLKSLKGVTQVRGKGLMIAVELKKNNAKDVVNKCLKNSLLINAPADNVLRFLPPLVVAKKDADKCIKILSKVL